MKTALLIFSAVVTAQPLVNDDVLEPSVGNEVDHAISIAPTNPPPSAAAPFSTNGLSRTAIAVRLVSSQRADGRWLAGTNDVTAAALDLLKSL
ncbi:MAG: hypothetical protein J6T01_06400 [Kiritimatiellae bacterium]|nr:hypothetical protein [Kiritimatiellia bacterium]